MTLHMCFYLLICSSAVSQAVGLSSAGCLWWGVTLYCVKASLRAGPTLPQSPCAALLSSGDWALHQRCNSTRPALAHSVIVLSHRHTGHEHTVLTAVQDWAQKHHVCPEHLKTHSSNSNHLLIYTCETGKGSEPQNGWGVEGTSGDHPSNPPAKAGSQKQVTQDSAIVFASIVNIQDSTFHCQSTAEVAEANWSLPTILSLRLYENFNIWILACFVFFFCFVLVLGWRGSCIYFLPRLWIPKIINLKFQQFLSLKLWNIN